jgi:site-specific recombinase XerD
MSPLRLALEDYLVLRRSLGFKLERAAKLLAQFVAFCEDAGADVVTTELALTWAASPKGASTNWVGHRLSVVRSFARYLVFFDDRTQVPPAGVWPEGTHRASPYLYSPAEVTALMAATSRFGSPLRRATLSSIVGLLYVSGMRVGEVLRLGFTPR